MELIDRRAAIEAIDDLPNCYNGYSDTYDKAYIIGVLEKLPSVDVPDTNIGDMISRQAAIDVADAVWSVTGDKNVAKVWDQIKDLPSAQPEQRWVPVSERLPEEKDAGILKKLGTEKRSEYVLATVEVKGERMTVTACTYDGKWDWNMKYAFPDFKVVAWMPLPEPYKEEQE